MSIHTYTCPQTLKDGVYKIRFGTGGGVGGEFMTAVEPFKAIQLLPENLVSIHHQKFRLAYNHQLKHYVVTLMEIQLPPVLGLSYIAKPGAPVIFGRPDGFCVYPMLGGAPGVYKMIAAQGENELVVSLAPLIVSPPRPPLTVDLREGSSNVWEFIPVYEPLPVPTVPIQTCPQTLKDGVYRIRFGKGESFEPEYMTSIEPFTAIELSPKLPKTELRQKFRITYNQNLRHYVITLVETPLPPVLGLSYKAAEPGAVVILGMPQGFCFEPSQGPPNVFYKITAATGPADLFVALAPLLIWPPPPLLLVELIKDSDHVWEFVPAEESEEYVV